MDRHEHILVSTINAFERSWGRLWEPLRKPQGLLAGVGGLVEPRKCWEGARAVLGRILKALGTFRGRFRMDFGAPRGVSWSLLVVPGQA